MTESISYLEALFLTLLNISKVVRSWMVRLRGKRNIRKVLVESREGKKPLGRQRIRWEDNIKINVCEMGCGARTESI